MFVETVGYFANTVDFFSSANDEQLAIMAQRKQRTVERLSNFHVFRLFSA